MDHVDSVVIRQAYNDHKPGDVLTGDAAVSFLRGKPDPALYHKIGGSGAAQPKPKPAQTDDGQPDAV